MALPLFASARPLSLFSPPLQSPSFNQFCNRCTTQAPFRLARYQHHIHITSLSSEPFQDPESGTEFEPELDPDVSLNEADTAILADLRNDGSTSQILAVLKLPQLRPSRALSLLNESNVLHSQYRKTRIAAIDALGKLALPSQCPRIISVLEDDKDHSIRAAAAAALAASLTSGTEASTSSSSFEPAVHALRKAAINDEHFIVRYSSIVSLGNVRDTAAIALLLPLVRHLETPPLEASAAIDALGEILFSDDVSPDHLKVVLSRVADRDDLIRAAVARTLSSWRPLPAASDALKAMLQNEIKYGRSSFVLGLLRNFLDES